MISVSDLTPEALPAGADGVLLRFALKPGPAAMAAMQSLAAELAETPPAGMAEISPALVSVLVRYDRAATSREALAADLMARAERIAAERRPAPAPARLWRIPVAFGGDHGPQLAEVAGLMDLSEEAAVAGICAAELRVLAIGFAPGQPYIGLLPESWNFPRMSALNPAVPQGAVTVAVRQIVMFTADGTTGWRQVGRSGLRNFLPGREPPIAFRPGDAVRYEPVPAVEFDALRDAADGYGGAKLELRA
ncbi:allophanate hydrolase subunit 1 [Poseidonocella sp. HB161398]|uniref:5-oxoprolinase subunit B family protein n=1 Tax=Poseidonocella sp. HB161398 TaxID=2320855 RepID=UPI001486FCF7|nr:carboxyltransferase domain-containing protein [Poseidonocella sp. HB161398]